MFKEQHTSGALIGVMRESGWTMRSIASVVILTFGGLVTAPAVAAVKQEIKEIQWHKQEEGPGAKLSARLQGVRDHLALASKQDLKSGSFAHHREELKADKGALADLDQETLASFASVSKMIKDKHLPELIQQRELVAEKQYKTEMTALRQGLDAIALEKDDAKAQAKTKDVLDRLSKFQMERSPQKFDPKNLPNRSLKPDLTRVPHTTKKSFAEAGFVSNPRLMVATTASNFDYSQLPGASDPAYLAATTEVTLSPAVQAKAAELHNDPVEIYNWVRNNVQWQPTWGAVQDADLTLSAQRGNAFDISGLLIALLRASGIPARYVHGTINVPEARFRNWVGGFQNINAAVNFASAGGIPVKSLISGGKIVTVQMEHIWVEAAIDYIPSRGAVNKSADTWVPMDASYKQYQYRQALDVLKISNVDVNGLAQQFSSSGSVNSQGYWASGQNIAAVQNAATIAQQALASYLQSNIPNATVEDVIGGADIIQTATRSLSATAPNQIVLVGASYSQVPASLEQSISFAFGVDATGEPLSPITMPWGKVNNQLITLSFDPATQADQSALDALVTIDSSGQAIFPTAIPGYLINVVPKLQANGNVLAIGSPTAMGSDVTFYFSPSFAGRASVPFTYDLAAGSYVAFSTIGGNISPTALSSAQSQLQALTNGTSSSDLRRATLGTAFQAGLLGYYLQYMEGAKFLGSRQGGNLYLAAGLGTLGLEPTVNYSFGIPTALTGNQLVLNLPMVNVFGFDSSNSQAKINYVLGVGQLSSVLECAVPNQLLAGAGETLGGASAETALAAASSQGMPIYHINQSNQGAILPLLNQLPIVTSEIKDALASGKEVVVSSSAVSVPGFKGSGYIIYDPQTGDGAYKIAGGQNGFKGDFDPTLPLYMNLWSLLFWVLNFSKYIRGASMVTTAFSFVTDLVNIQKHCSGAMLLKYTWDYAWLFVFLIALTTFFGPLGIVLMSILSPFILGFAMDMITAECDSFPNG